MSFDAQQGYLDTYTRLINSAWHSLFCAASYSSHDSISHYLCTLGLIGTCIPFINILQLFCTKRVLTVVYCTSSEPAACTFWLHLVDDQWTNPINVTGNFDYLRLINSVEYEIITEFTKGLCRWVSLLAKSLILCYQ